jgi:hypothetical protein
MYNIKGWNEENKINSMKLIHYLREQNKTKIFYIKRTRKHIKYKKCT